MPNSAEITITDSGWTLPADLSALDGEEIQAGILEGTDAHEGISTASLGLLHEDGAPAANVPARPWMRPTFDGRVGAYEDAVEHAVARTIAGASPGMELVQVADRMAKDMRDTIEKGKTGGPPLRPLDRDRRRLRRKGKTPLIDSGALVESINGQVVRRGR